MPSFRWFLSSFRLRSRMGCGLMVLGVSALCAAPAGLAQQVASVATPDTAEVAATRAKAIAMRDAFVAKVKAAGFSCPIAPPAIVVTDIPSWGNYNEETNTLSTSEWTLLQPREKAFFKMLAGPNATDAEVQELFDRASHRWIFVHEMGHWWQACRHQDAKPYATEYGADRIAMAYWREADATVVPRMMPVFHVVLDHMPSPVPDGQEVEAYFNANYQTLGPSPAYPWFQSRMVVTAFEETPAPTFAMTLGQTK
ncbi:hypothetical protein SAMN05421819_3658 [Bryocella elongata]|uniref:Uncharacterized protein n=1 Tax=Bryocella elongata TaxID=863522 RepID=A0A1H6BEZ2_9BACT|nr:hypothetical protein [Bryocella elongata]SEG59333.1 hypothetical protein SAMN05421819_3658 [Bryocella elongata]